MPERCGVARAGRGGQPPTLIFLTDGEQNVNGGWGAARDTTASIKAEGARLMMVGYGDGVNYGHMETMASQPNATCPRPRTP